MTSQDRHESPEIGSAIARLVRGLVERAAAGDSEALEQLAALEQLLPHAVQVAGHALHKGGSVQGYSFSELGAILGISRQAALKRFGSAPVDTQPLAIQGEDWATWGWSRMWADKRISSPQIMRSLLARLASRRAA